MSLVVNLAVLAEGAAPDARGNITLIAANPQALLVDQFPSQVNPTFFVVVEEDEEGGNDPVIVAGRKISLRVEVVGPDHDVVFFSQVEQPVLPLRYPSLHPRIQMLAQIPFSATKAGDYVISARIGVSRADGGQDEVVEAIRKVLVMDGASLKA